MDGPERGQHDMESTVTGRPSSYTQDTADVICSRLAQGESLRRICQDRDLPSLQTVMNWLAKNGDFVEQYARAREAQADHFVDEIVEIADTEGDANKARVRIDARKWVAGKQRPKKYGDKLVADLNHGAQDSLAELMKAIDGRSRGIPG